MTLESSSLDLAYLPKSQIGVGRTRVTLALGRELNTIQRGAESVGLHWGFMGSSRVQSNGRLIVGFCA